jgi:Fur family peroxide stress response transcriptional regulator
VKHDKRDEFSEEEFNAFRKVCKERGIKVTPQRLEIFREVMKAQDHPSAEDIYKRVKDRLPSISLDTVYRTLAALESFGLIGRVPIVDKTRFDPNRKLHHHLVCTVCKGLTDFYWAEFDRLEPPLDISEWGHPETRHVQIMGICSKCAKKKRKS